MYRVFIKPSELVFRSFDIYEVNEYLLENKRGDYIFLKEYVVFSAGEFVKHFFVETEDYKLTLELEKALKRTTENYKYLKDILNKRKEPLTIFQYIEDNGKKSTANRNI